MKIQAFSGMFASKGHLTRQHIVSAFISFYNRFTEVLSRETAHKKGPQNDNFSESLLQ